MIWRQRGTLGASHILRHTRATDEAQRAGQALVRGGELIEPLIPLLIPMAAWWEPIVGFFNAIMTPLYWVVSGLLVFFHYLWAPLFGTDNGWTWTLAIVCLTVIIRTALIPLFVKQIKSSRSMQLLQPKVRELQKKYGHDREKLGAETMKLYKDNNANPSLGLPLLLQSRSSSRCLV